MSQSASHREALDQLWARYEGKWRRLLSRHVVKELTLRASFDPDTIEPHKVALEIPAGTVPDCEVCPNICCAGLENVVSLRLVDIATLLDIGREDLMSKKKPQFPLHMLRERPALRELVTSELWQSLPVLRQVGPAKACAALDKNMRCSLHPHWPTSCRRFPYTLSKVRRRVFWGKRCPVDTQGPQYLEQARDMFTGSIDAYNERVKDAVLLHHARGELAELGIGPWITGPKEEPFEETPPGLDVIQ